MRQVLYIGGQKADLSETGLILMNWRLSDLYNPTAVRNSYSQDITLPGTPANDKILGHYFRLDRRLAPAEDAPALRMMLRAAATPTAVFTPAAEGPGPMLGAVAANGDPTGREVTLNLAFTLQTYNSAAGGAFDAIHSYFDYGGGHYFQQVLFVQGIGYDSDGNKMAATPAQVLYFGTADFTAAQMASVCEFTPDALNTSLVAVSDNVDYEWQRSSGNGYFLRAEQISLALTATGLARMEVNMYAYDMEIYQAAASNITGGSTSLGTMYGRKSPSTIRYVLPTGSVYVPSATASAEGLPDPEPDPPTPPTPPEPSGSTWGGFDASRRVSFAIFSDSGEILADGYCRLTGIVETAGIHTYSLALFGGLGGFLYNLSQRSDGQKRTLADLSYLGGGDSELDFTITKEAVADAWARLDGDTSKSEIWDIINFAPCLNGFPENFSPDKAIAAPGKVGIPVPAGAHATGGYCLLNLAEDLDEWAAKDLRSYLQRPVISMRKIIAACADPDNNGGWAVDYSDIADSPYLDTWLTRPLLPSLGTYKQISGNLAVSLNPIGWSASTSVGTFVLENAPLGSEVTARLSFILGYRVADAPASLRTFKRVEGQSYVPDGYLQQVLFVQAVGLASDNSEVAAGRVKAYYRDYALVPPAQMAQACGFTPNALNTEYESAENEHSYLLSTGTTYARAAAMSAEVSGENIAKINIVIKAYQCLVGDNGAVYYATGTDAPFARLYDIDGNEFTPTDATLLSGSGTATMQGPDALRSGALITKQMLLSTSKTPAEYLVSFCRMFGYYIVANGAEKSVTILRRASFFREETRDLTERVDRTHPIQIDPLTFNAKWYELAQDSAGGRFADEYLRTEGVEYGTQRLDTGYDFDAETVNLLDGSAFKSAVSVLDRGKYWCYLTDAPAVFLSPGNTATFRDDDEAGVDMDIPIPNRDEIGYYNAVRNFYDFQPKTEFRDAENKGIDGADVLLLHGVALDTYAQFHLSDDLPVMDTLNNGPCWLIDPSEPGMIIPEFTRMLIVADALFDTLDFGAPRATDYPDLKWVANKTIYEREFRAFLRDRFSADNRVMKCRVDLSGWQPGTDLLRPFYWYRNSLWCLVSVTNYSLTTPGPAECEFVQVRDIANYKTQY